MKKNIINGVIVFAIGLFAPQITQAQGTITYLSSLGASTGSPSVGSDSWLAAEFSVGSNVGGYTLDSIQLGMADATGNPSGFTAMLYTAIIAGAVLPGSSLGTLTGSLSPVSAGTYTYTPASSLTLLPGFYFIVLTAGTTVANGAYEWSESAFPPNSNGGWGDDNAVLHSSNGISGWSVTPYLGIAQFAITATPIPEPSSLGLLVLGGLGFLWHRHKTKAV
jgi:hypothetical protein